MLFMRSTISRIPAYRKEVLSDLLPAFRAWFSPVELSSLTMPALMIGSPETTGIGLTSDSSLNKEQRADAWYDLSGRKVANGQKPKANGLYINNGKKTVIQ